MNKEKDMQMNAIVYTTYGSPDVLHLSEVAKPTPIANEILVKVYATTVNYGDLTARNFKNIPLHEFNMPTFFMLPARFAFGFNAPKNPVLGSEFAGIIEVVGKEVTRFKVGDSVFGFLGQGMGAYAEYVRMAEDGLVAIKPSNMSYAEAATIPYGGIMALNLLRKAAIQPSQKVLIHGASGGIGSIAVQLAKFHFGAEVTAVCSTPRLDYVKSLGADHVIDYTQTDFTQNGETYDLIFDVLGRSSFARCKDSLTENGRYLLASFKTKQLIQMVSTAIADNKKVICALASENREDLLTIKELVEAGKIKSIIDKSYPLAQASKAHRYVEEGRKKGNVVVTVVPE